jgi:hypothetical protein
MTTAAAWDALALDGELEELFHARLQRALASSKSAQRLQPEVRACLRAALLWLSSAASPGEALLGLRRGACGTERRREVALPAVSTSATPLPASRALAHAALVVLLPWVWVRLSQLLSSSGGGVRDVETAGRRLRVVRRLEGLAALASLLVTLRFLRRGGAGAAPTLPMLLAGIGLARALPAAPRPPAFDFMEQQLVWRSVADLLLAGRRVWHSAAATSATSAAPPLRWPLLWQRLGLLPADADAAAEAGGVDPAACVFCAAAAPHTPRELPCGHHACYYCLTTARMASSRARCPASGCGVWLAARDRSGQGWAGRSG